MTAGLARSAGAAAGGARARACLRNVSEARPRRRALGSTSAANAHSVSAAWPARWPQTASRSAASMPSGRLRSLPFHASGPVCASASTDVCGVVIERELVLRQLVEQRPPPVVEDIAVKVVLRPDRRRRGPALGEVGTLGPRQKTHGHAPNLD